MELGHVWKMNEDEITSVDFRKVCTYSSLLSILKFVNFSTLVKRPTTFFKLKSEITFAYIISINFLNEILLNPTSSAYSATVYCIFSY